MVSVIKLDRRHSMSVQYLSTFDPMLEFNFILERCFGQPANIPN